MKCCRELLCYGKYWKELLSLLLCKVLVSAAHCFNENWEDNSWCSNMIFFITRSCAALRAADLDWIVGPEYSLGGYITLDGGGGAGQE